MTAPGARPIKRTGYGRTPEPKLCKVCLNPCKRDGKTWVCPRGHKQAA